MKYLGYLDLSNNHLFGEVPQCWWDMKDLVVLNLAENHFSGEIPSSVGSMIFLRSLHLNSNIFSGVLLLSLANCKNLVVLDLGNNRLHGNIPTWVGESFPLLMILLLHSNMFTGSIPLQLAHLDLLQLLDLADNSLTGCIPRSFGNFTAMTVRPPGMDFSDTIASFGYSDVSWKGREFGFLKTLALIVGIDLSNNNLTLEIPEEITSLRGLILLNLSRNHLSGNMPKSIGDLYWLESFDLSMNHLSGTIPPTISSLTFIAYLNLSYNNFSGKIPSGNQLQTLNDSSIYIGNYALCGEPLKRDCSDDDEVPSDGRMEGYGNELRGIYLIMGLGFVMGYMGFWGTLICSRSRRTAYFKFIDDLQYILYG